MKYFSLYRNLAKMPKDSTFSQVKIFLNHVVSLAHNIINVYIENGLELSKENFLNDFWQVFDNLFDFYERHLFEEDKDRVRRVLCGSLHFFKNAKNKSSDSLKDIKLSLRDFPAWLSKDRSFFRQLKNALLGDITTCLDEILKEWKNTTCIYDPIDFFSQYYRDIVELQQDSVKFKERFFATIKELMKRIADAYTKNNIKVTDNSLLGDFWLVLDYYYGTNSYEWETPPYSSEYEKEIDSALLFKETLKEKIGFTQYFGKPLDIKFNSIFKLPLPREKFCTYDLLLYYESDIRFYISCFC